jgi:anti-sigma B factor antagonist
MENFGLTHREIDERTCVVAVEGELDLASAPYLKLALVELLAKGYGRYVLDLSQVTYMDSMGLGVLIGFHKRLHGDARLTLAGVPPKPRKLLELTGLDTRFDSFATVDDALSDRAESALPFCTDAAMVLGIASTALPFATTRRAEALRWLRILRLQGEAARVLCALGVGETPLPDLDQDDDELLAPAGRADRDPVASVSELAVRVARKRGVAKVGTGDILVAVLRFYGSDFDLVLAAHGTDRDEVIGRLDEAA